MTEPEPTTEPTTEPTASGGAPAAVRRPSLYSTSYLLTAAAIAAATAVLLIAGNWIAYATIAVPWLNGVTLGLWVLPFALALRLLPLPGTTLLVGLIAGIVMGPFQPDGFRAIVVNLWYAAAFEVVFAVTLYRIRRTWLFIASGAISGVVWGILVALTLDAGQMVPGVIAATVLIPTASAALGAWLGVVIADALVARGVGATTRKRLEQRRATTAKAKATAPA